MLELMMPAASIEAVIAAVQNGADSVYIKFGGGGVVGFSQEDFGKAVRYCRVRGCRVYAELESMVTDAELEAAAGLAEGVSDAGVEAVIVHDLGLVSFMQAAAPDVRVFAGERMGLHNLAGLEAAAQLGVSRVLLPPELSLEEIRSLARRSSVELAVTVQGSLCSCRQGLCYMSAITDRVSANRGACTQSCRDMFSMGSRMDDYPLSLKDVRLATHIKALAESGVTCVRVGAGLDTPEQAALLSDVYSRCIKEGRTPVPEELERMDLAFSDRSFTDGYLTGERGDEMYGLYGEPDRDAPRLFAELRRGYEASELRRVPVQFYCVIKRNQPLQLAAEDADGNRAVFTGAKVTVAKGSCIKALEVEQELYKTGGTPYLCTRVHSLVEEGLELPEFALVEARRAVIRQLTDKRGVPPQRKKGKAPALPESAVAHDSMRMIFQVMTADQLTEELARLRPAFLYVPLELAAASQEPLRPFMEGDTTVAVVLPPVINDGEFVKAADLLRAVRSFGITQALCGNLGHIALARAAGMDVRGDWGLNIYNSHALQTAADAGLMSATLSFELPMAAIKKLRKPLDTELIVYGRLPVMVTEMCVIKKGLGRCSCSAPARLANNGGSVYTALREFGCRSAIYGSTKLYMADRSDEMKQTGLWGARLLFTTESSRECEAVAKSYMGLSGYRPNGLTRGLY